MSSVSCPADVPQGSVISPTLFSVHINNIEHSVPNSIAVDTHKYADDCTLDQSIKECDVSLMQEVLDSMQTWADFIKMALNSKKTKDMWICFCDCIPEPLDCIPYNWWRDDRKNKLV
jgi:retron-type reverse transcriptase